MNFATSSIDGSVIYGSDPNREFLLRTHTAGLMKTSQGVNEAEMLPLSINDPTKFLVGDDRVNDHQALMALSTLFIREHNRKAREISASLNLTDEEIYQQARIWVSFFNLRLLH